MIDPLFAILFVIGIFAVLGILFWPESGIISKVKKAGLNKQRIMIEDALKHIYHCEYEQVMSSIDSIAGNLEISGDSSAKLVSKLESMNLVKSNREGIKLTPDGRTYALRIIRIHRLWERYLADETGVKETDWHKEAEFVEHNLSAEEADKLAGKMGNPIIDPHGDPIPTPTGEIPESNWVSLNSLKDGEFAHISHLEDEPSAIYSQLSAEGLHVGMQVRIIESTNERVRFEADGEEVVLAPIFAANISVVPIRHEVQDFSEYKKLSALKQGEELTIVGISKACRGLQRRRLLDFGMVPGSKIKAKLSSMGGDPVAYEIKGTTIALRRDQADLIYVREN